jgi:hypothetical protein
MGAPGFPESGFRGPVSFEPFQATCTRRFPERELRAADGRSRHGATALIDPHRRRETSAAIVGTGIEQIPVVCIAGVINEVQGANVIDCGLRLDATTWHPVHAYARLQVLLFRKTGKGGAKNESRLSS